jgi:xylulose-5-phosphate/fructose-6-phosphate phosphoketolase
MGAIAEDELRDLHDYWCAANYLTVGQIYLLANPLLREPLREHFEDLPEIRDWTWASR